jgi:hypothetical protein
MNKQHIVILYYSSSSIKIYIFIKVYILVQKIAIGIKPYNISRGFVRGTSEARIFTVYGIGGNFSWYRSEIAARSSYNNLKLLSTTRT